MENENKIEELFNTLKECMVEYNSLDADFSLEKDIKYHIKNYKRYIKNVKETFKNPIIDFYKDGGTMEIVTDKGNFFIDDRISSETKGKIYSEYPKRDNSNVLENQDEIKNHIIKYIEPMKFDYKEHLIELLK